MFFQKHSFDVSEGFSCIQSHWGDSFKVVAITASKQLRFERVQARARSEDGDLSDLEKRDEREDKREEVREKRQERLTHRLGRAPDRIL